MLGFKYNFTDLQAAIGLKQLEKLERFQLRREELAVFYDGAFSGRPGVRLQPRGMPGRSVRHALHLYLLVLEPDVFRGGRDAIVAALRAENIGAAIHYNPLHHEPYYRRRLGGSDASAEYPHATALGARLLTLPLSPAMTDSDAADVVSATQKVLDFYSSDP